MTRARGTVAACGLVVGLALASTPASGQGRGRGAQPDTPAVADVKLDSVRGGGASPKPRVTRNPFRFYEPPAPAAARPRATAPPPAPVFQPPPAPTGPPPPPPITLRFIGLIEAPQRAGRVALLSDGRGGLMNGKEGDIIEGRYRLVRVGTDSLDIAYSDGRGRQTIRLSGQ